MKLKHLLEQWKSRKGYVAIAANDFENLYGTLEIDLFRGLFAFRTKEEAERFAAGVSKLINKPEPNYHDLKTKFEVIECRYDLLMIPWIVAWVRHDYILREITFLCVGKSEQEIRDDYEDELKKHRDVVFLSLDDPEEEEFDED